VYSPLLNLILVPLRGDWRAGASLIEPPHSPSTRELNRDTNWSSSRSRGTRPSQSFLSETIPSLLLSESADESFCRVFPCSEVQRVPSLVTKIEQELI